MANKKLKACRRVELGPGTGVIGSLFDDKGFGFIINDNQDLDDVFFHYSEYPAHREIHVGAQVSFSCEKNTKTNKFKAVQIKIIKDVDGASIGAKSKDGHRRGRMPYPAHHTPAHHTPAHHANAMHVSQTHTVPSHPHNPVNVSATASAASPDKHVANTAADAPKLGCFKLVKKDVTQRPMYVPVFPLCELW
eukprot:CAMPEP_0202693680 /NCGR_PEP_ID=MMETSP1385-20130828/7723_1 /ASSEMBLY_ACC=CAM_ASM_000861 /TAXON_ID=933848 /ORGANISM="Elphidium margaritaceum" /LENGTH=191 /DNA_ID=CAMNT_0049349389 /DNA_START=24 /DNA_END=596 /DNA_ORIENTATION=+